MTREEAIALLNNLRAFAEDDDEPAIDMAIEALSDDFTINGIADEIHKNAIDHGWWDEDRSFGEIIALCHSELSEALEAYRNGEPMVWMNGEKPDGIAIEMIDCIIRILDYLASEGIDIDRMMYCKHEYNKTRPYKHGGKKL